MIVCTFIIIPILLSTDIYIIRYSIISHIFFQTTDNVSVIEYPSGHRLKNKYIFQLKEEHTHAYTLVNEDRWTLTSVKMISIILYKTEFFW